MQNRLSLGIESPTKRRQQRNQHARFFVCCIGSGQWLSCGRQAAHASFNTYRRAVPLALQEFRGHIIGGPTEPPIAFQVPNAFGKAKIGELDDGVFVPRRQQNVFRLRYTTRRVVADMSTRVESEGCWKIKVSR